MTIDDAIQYCEEAAKNKVEEYRLCPYPGEECIGDPDCRCLKTGKGKGCLKRAKEYRQLAAWLEELKKWRENGQVSGEAPASDSISRQAAIDAAATLYGYKIEHLATIACILQKEKLPPERVAEALTDVGRIASIVRAELEEELRKAVERCMI